MIEVAGTTDRGVSKPLNEDRIVVQDEVVCGGSVHLQTAAPLCVAVLDGVSTGGHGSEAVGVAAAGLSEGLSGAAPARTSDDLGDLFAGINADLRAYAQERLSGAQLATTVGGLLFGPEGSLCAFFAGDSRVYRLRAGRLEQLSHDHTIMQRLKDEDATELLAGMAQAGAHSVTRALGRDDANPVELSAGLDAPRAGDVYLICSDGVSDGLPDETLARVMGEADTPLDDRARDLVARAKAEGGSNDNVTAVLVRVYDDGLTGDATGYAEAVEAGAMADAADEGAPDGNGEAPVPQPSRAQGEPAPSEAPAEGQVASASEGAETTPDAPEGPGRLDDEPAEVTAADDASHPSARDLDEETERILRAMREPAQAQSDPDPDSDPDKTGVLDYEAVARAKEAAESDEDMAAFEQWVSGDDARPVEDDGESEGGGRDDALR